MATGEPEQALKELEDLEQEELTKKRELEKLKQRIKTAAKQVKEEREFEEKVPIPQVASKTTTGLSAEEKAILNVHKGKKEDSEDKEKTDEDGDKKSLEKKAKTKSGSSLETTVAAERLSSSFRPNSNEMSHSEQHYQQIIEMSQQPMTQLYDQMKNIYDSSVATGYVSGPAAAQTFELESAIERKLHDIEAGNYQFTNEQTVKAASVSLSMKERVSAMYVAGKDHSQNDLYK
ncbi:hypothetical protein CL619_04655 [archaeon]|nr:hypothetical protein [archaeon]|tara:strand:- start:5087 stop:5785 length:699 start_codon:yes stop_codon:yes gene_type:complete